MSSSKIDIDINEYYRKYGPMVLRRCRFILRDEDKALDAMQDVFVKLINYQDKLSGEYPSSLLYRMATNVCLNIIRANKRQVIPDKDDMITNIACYDQKEDTLMYKDLLDRIFKKEKSSTRVIAMLHYVDGLTLVETAEKVNLSVSGVRKRLRELKRKVNINKELTL